MGSAIPGESSQLLLTNMSRSVSPPRAWSATATDPTTPARQVSQALWLTTQVPQQGLADSADMVTLNELALEPSAQLRLLHKLAVAKLQPLNAGAALGGAGEDEMPVETETEMC